MLKFRFMLALAAGLAATPALAQADLLTEKKTFEMPSYTTVGGGTIRNVRIGWESYGTLNADRSNAVLITVYLAEGNVSDALRQYDVYSTLLDRELGLPPSERIYSLLPETKHHRDAVVTTGGS